MLLAGVTLMPTKALSAELAAYYRAKVKAQADKKGDTQAKQELKQLIKDVDDGVKSADPDLKQIWKDEVAKRGG